MKKFSKKITALLLCVLFVFQLPITAFAAQTTSSIFVTDKKYTHNSRFDGFRIKQGIDVSAYNETIDWNKVKAAGVDFAVIRLGYCGYTQSKHSYGNLDAYFERNLQGAVNAGIAVGVYYYSQALTTAEAKTEANFVLQKLNGRKLDLPVYFDYEFAEKSAGRLDAAWKNKTLTKAKMTDNAIAFCEVIENAGYVAGVYANKSFFTDQLDHTQLEDKYYIWLAHYVTKTDYSGEYQMWQYSSNGKVSGATNGIATVDSNFMYVMPVISTISSQKYTGKAIEPKITVKYDGKTLQKDTDYTVSYKNNINIGTAEVTVNGLGDYERIINNEKETFKIIPQTVKNLKYSARTTSSITVKWDKDTQAEGYNVQVYRSGKWVSAGNTAATSFKVTGLSNASNYSIKVRAYKTVKGTKYYGSYSNTVADATMPAKVTSLKASTSTNTSITLTWKKQSGASYYNVYKYNSKTKKYDLYKKVSSGSKNSLKVTGLKANTSYKFKVRAYKIKQDKKTLTGDMSSVLTAYTKPSAPKLSSLSAPSKKKVNVKWKKVSGITGYQIMWSTSKSFSSNTKTYDVKSSKKVSQKISTAKSKKKYYVRIRSYKTRNGKKYYSAWSNVKSIKTK